MKVYFIKENLFSKKRPIKGSGRFVSLHAWMIPKTGKSRSTIPRDDKVRATDAEKTNTSPVIVI